MTPQELKDNLSQELYGTTTEAAIASGLCIQCRRRAEQHCYSNAGLREFRISGLCEECFDSITYDPEEYRNTGG